MKRTAIDPTDPVGVGSNPTPSVEEYLLGLRNINLTPRRAAMLKAHLLRPSITARAMAEAVGLPSHREANIQYGSLAWALAQAMDRKIPSGHDKVTLIARMAPPRSGGEWRWILHQNLKEALRIIFSDAAA